MSLSERDRRELSDLASSAADGRISPQDAARLDAILRDSAEAREFYVRFMDVSAGVAWAARAQPEAAAIAGRIVPDPALTQSRGKWIASVAVATLALATAGTWAFFKQQPPAAPAPVASLTGIATLSTAMNVQWAGAQEPNHVGNMLKPGWVRIKSGMAQIDFLNGASVWLEGPVELRLDSAHEAYCDSGKVVAQVPRGASDFRLGAPYLSAIEKATGFGVEVNKGTLAAVHVFRGTVEVTLNDGKQKRELGAGQAISVDPSGATSLMNADPNAFSNEEFGGRWESRPFPALQWNYGQPDWTHGPYMGGSQAVPSPVMIPGLWRGADPMEAIRAQLGSSEQRWTEIKKPLEAFLMEQWKSWGLDNNLGEAGVSRAKWDLMFAVENPHSSDEELATRVQALRSARMICRKQLATYEQELRDILSEEEEVRLVLLGYMP